MRRFELIDPSINASKFWQINQKAGRDVLIEYGRIGGTPSSSSYSFNSDREAIAFIESRIKEKLGKGYREVLVAKNLEAGRMAPSPTKAPKPKKSISTVSAATEDLPQTLPRNLFLEMIKIEQGPLGSSKTIKEQKPRKVAARRKLKL